MSVGVNLNVLDTSFGNNLEDYKGLLSEVEKLNIVGNSLLLTEVLDISPSPRPPSGADPRLHSQHLLHSVPLRPSLRW